MVIRRGEAWGGQGPLPSDGIVVGSDAEARAVVEEARRRGDTPPPLGLVGGDLCRTLGGTGDLARLRRDDATRVRVDVGAVVADGRQLWFVAHLIARRSWWWGRAVAVMNAESLGEWRLGPRAHPADGLLDVSDGDLPPGDRLKARRRLRTGDHLPHPSIATSRVSGLDLAFDRPMPIWLDSVPEGRVRALSISVEPDAVEVVV